MLRSQWARRAGLVALVAAAAAPALSATLTYNDHSLAPVSVGTTRAWLPYGSPAAEPGSLGASASGGSSASGSGQSQPASPPPASQPAPAGTAASAASPSPSALRPSTASSPASARPGATTAQRPAARTGTASRTAASAQKPRAAATTRPSPFVRSAAGNRGTQAAPSTDPARRVLELTNAERAKAGLAPLTWNPCLTQVAQPFSQTLASSGQLFHNSMGTVLSACGGRTAAENVAMGYQTPEAVVAGWMASPGHRANILNPQLRTLGVGIARDGSGAIYWVQNFDG